VSSVGPAPTPRGPDALRADASTLLGFGVGSVLFGGSFGVVMSALDAPLPLTVLASALIFGGGAQFGALGILSAGGSPVAAVAAGLLLNARFAAMGMALAPRLRVGLLERLLMGVVSIDASLGVGLAQPDGEAARRAYWRVGLVVWLLWVSGTVAGALAGALIADPETLGIDASLPAMFLVLLHPQLRGTTARRVALAGGLVALVLLPITPPGTPVLAAGLAALVGALRSDAADPEIGEAESRGDADPGGAP
jgi:4-azaleucine resistance transporter AzlC